VTSRLWARIGLPALLAALAAGYLWLTARVPLPPFGGPVNARVFPTILGVGLLFAALLLAVEERGRQHQEPAADDGARPDLRLVAAISGWMLLYILALERAGFILATSVFLAGLTLLFHRRRPWVAVAASVGFAVVIHLLFVQVLGVSLPAGPLF